MIRCIQRNRSALFVSLFVLAGLLAALLLSDSHQMQRISGGCDQRHSPYITGHYDYRRVITYCEAGDASTGEITTDYFQSSTQVRFDYAGYPSEQGIDIFLRSSSGKYVRLELPNAGESWRTVRVLVPSELRTGEIQLVARDQTSRSFGWIGIGNVTDANCLDSHELLLMLGTLVVIHLLLVTWLAFLQPCANAEVAPLLLIVLIGLAGYTAFWAYWSSIILGQILSVTFLFGTLTLLIIRYRWKGVASFRAAHGVLLPVSLYVLFILILGYFPFDDVSASGAMNRWLNLPIDNILPEIFADQLRDGHVTIPMVGDWHSSDRPPLQAGIYLLFLLRSDLLYQVLSSVMQGLVLLPFLVLVRRLGLPRLAPLAAVAFGLTGLMAVHTLFVWPKLLSTAYLLIFYLVTMTTFGNMLSRTMWLFLAGSTAAMAMLSHGGAFFALVVIAVCYLARYPSYVLINGIPAAALSIVLYIPWLLYQRLFDPPGNRLVKWHLAGIIEVNDMTVTQALGAAYAALDLSAWLDGRAANLGVVFEGTEKFFKDLFFVATDSAFTMQNWRSSLMTSSFYETFYSFWWLSPILALAVWGVLRSWRKHPLSQDLVWLTVSTLATLLLWCALMYIPASTVIHQGTFFPWVSLFIIANALLWQASHLLFLITVSLNAAVFISVYALDNIMVEIDAGYIYLMAVSLSLLAFIYACMSGVRWLDLPAPAKTSIPGSRNCSNPLQK